MVCQKKMAMNYNNVVLTLLLLKERYPYAHMHDYVYAGLSYRNNYVELHLLQVNLYK